MWNTSCKSNPTGQACLRTKVKIVNCCEMHDATSNCKRELDFAMAKQRCRAAYREQSNPYVQRGPYVSLYMNKKIMFELLCG